MTLHIVNRDAEHHATPLTPVGINWPRTIVSCLELVLTRFGLVDTLPHLFAGRGDVTMDRDTLPTLGIDRRTWKVGIVVGHSSSILVVDGLSETTAVLKAVFEPRGHAVNRIRQSQLPTTPAPRVVIWHADESETTLPVSRFPGVPRILIGRADLSATDAETPRFSQPFEYCELLRTIESLLAKKDVA